MFDNIIWLGHASFRIELSKTIYIDPWKITDPEIADLILLSHPHDDHFSIQDLEMLVGPKTAIVTISAVAQKLPFTKNPVHILAPGQSITIGEITITATPAYNTDKPFHKKEYGWVGFIIQESNYRIYYAGDTDLIPEMQNLENIDLALLPISGVYVMNPKQAAKAAAIIKPAYVFPYHYGTIVGGEDELKDFKHYLFDLDPNITLLD